MSWHAIISAHARGEYLAPEVLLAAHPLERVATYRKGELGEGGVPHERSGFVTGVGEARSQQELDELIMNHVRNNGQLYSKVIAAGGEVFVAVGLDPHEPDAAVTLGPGARETLSKAGIAVRMY